VAVEMVFLRHLNWSV